MCSHILEHFGNKESNSNLNNIMITLYVTHYQVVEQIKAHKLNVH